MEFDKNRLNSGLEKLLNAKSTYQRMIARRSVNNAMPTGRGNLTPLLWGGVMETYVTLCIVIVGLSLVSLAGIAYAFTQAGKPIPLGGYNLVIVIAIIAACPGIGVLRRRMALSSRKTTSDETFLAAIKSAAPQVPDDFAKAARKAIAEAYSVAPNLIGASDTPRQCNAFSLLSGPLALEVIAAINIEEHLRLKPEQLVSAAAAMKPKRAATVAALIAILYERISEAKNNRS